MANKIHLTIIDLLKFRDKLKESALLINDLCIETNERIATVISSEWDDAQAQHFKEHWEQESRGELLKLSQSMWNLYKYIDKKTEIAQRYLSKRIY